MEIYGGLSCLVWHFDVIFLGLASVGQFLIAKSPIILVEGWSSGWIAALGGEDTDGSGAGTTTWKTELVWWQDLCHTFDDLNLYKDWNRWTPYNTLVALDIMHDVDDGVFLYVSCEFHVWYSRFWHDTCNNGDKLYVASAEQHAWKIVFSHVLPVGKCCNVSWNHCVYMIQVCGPPAPPIHCRGHHTKTQEGGTVHPVPYTLGWRVADLKAYILYVIVYPIIYRF